MARNSLKSVLRLIDDAKQEAPVEQSFLAQLKKSIEMDEEKNRRAPSQTYKPSSMNCIRNMYYQVTGHEQDPSSSDYSMIGICNSGTDTHERIQKYVEGMKANGFDCEYVDVGEYVKSRNLGDIEVVSKNGMETKLRHNELNLSFMCDGIIRYKGRYYILELKTESSFKWQNREGVDPKHYNQGICYSLALDIPDVIFVYINRDVSTMKSFMFTPTDEMTRELVNRLTECESYVDMGIAPPKPVNASNRLCGYCSYYNSCKADLN